MPLSASQFDKMLDRLLVREGGYVYDSRDPGGETKYGISKRSFPNEDIKNLTVSRAKEIYIQEFIRPNQLDKIENDHLREVILDWLVHSGASVVKSPARIKALQRLLDVEMDGKIGPQTIAKMNAMGEKLVKPILIDRMFFMARLTRHPYIAGWLKRLVELGLGS